MYSAFPSPMLRISATILDTILVLGFATIGMGIDSLFPFPEEVYPFFGTFLIVISIYQLVILSKTGQTLGKKICRIRIVKWSDGSNGGFLHTVFLRRIISILDMTLIVPLADFIMMCVSGSRRALHDLCAGTVVVNADNKELPINLPLQKVSNATKWTLGTVALSPVFLGLLFIGFIIFAIATEKEEQLSFSNDEISLEYSSRLSLDTSASDSETTMLVLSNITSSVSFELTKSSLMFLLSDSMVYDNFEINMESQMELDSLIATDTLSQYGKYHVQGQAYTLFLDDITLQARLYVIKEDDLICCITEISSDLFESSSKRYFKTVSESFQLKNVK